MTNHKVRIESGCTVKPSSIYLCEKDKPFFLRAERRVKFTVYPTVIMRPYGLVADFLRGFKTEQDRERVQLLSIRSGNIENLAFFIPLSYALNLAPLIGLPSECQLDICTLTPTTLCSIQIVNYLDYDIECMNLRLEGIEAA